MQYRKDRYGNDLSLLGYGCMRFSLKGGKPDVEKTEKELLYAIEQGVNYFDAAYIYPNIEATLGEILERNRLRDRVYIATKLPHYLLKKKEDPERIFREELSRLKTDHVDYYLMHMLPDVKVWEKLKDLGIVEWLAEKKRTGEVRQVGFSYHGGADMFLQLLDSYDWDFCQIQYNYLDENTQAGVTGLKAAAAKGIPVIIMEPLRGGRLVNHLPKRAKQAFDKAAVKRSPAEWGFRWLYNQPEVTVVLSGMNSMEMVEENVRIASETAAGSLSEEEMKIYKTAIDAFNRDVKVGCTGCRYCMPCPHNVDIPGIFAAYNHRYTDGLYPALKEYVMCEVLRKVPTVLTNCVGCGACERHCPQKIEIRKMLKKAGRVLENPAVKIVKWVSPKIVK